MAQALEFWWFDLPAVLRPQSPWPPLRYWVQIQAFGSRDGNTTEKINVLRGCVM